MSPPWAIVLGGFIVVVVLLAVVLVLVLTKQPTHDSYKPTEQDERLAFVFMTQSICLSPTQSDPYECPTATRDLLVGENLPYMNHDLYPETGETFQISNSFPMKHSDGSVRVLQTLDYVAHGAGLQPGNIKSFQFDVDYDGYNANSMNVGSQYVNILGTADPSSGVQLFVAPDCSLVDSWGLFGKEVFELKEGRHLFKLNVVRSALGDSGWECPEFYNDGYTTYEDIHNFTYSSGKVMETVKISHWGGTTVETATGAEKEFFTKEYGLTRWEAWVKGAVPGGGLLCGGPQSGEDGWVLVDCRDWSYTLDLSVTGIVYSGLRVPVHKDLIDGGNMLRNGDFGEGNNDESAFWVEFGENVVYNIAYQEDGNKMMKITNEKSGTGLEQIVKVGKGDWERLGFGGRLIGEGDTSVTVSLTQLNANGEELATIVIEVEACDGRNFEGFVKKIEDGCVNLRLRILMDSVGVCSIDDNYVGVLG